MMAVLGAWFCNHVGLMQGSSLSPFLYALFIDDLPKCLLSDFPSLPLGNSRVNSILYADDIALLAESPGTMQSMLDCCSQFALANHFHWGTQKCELLPSLLPVPLQPLSLQNESLKVTASFKYLGIFFNERGIDTDACVDRLGKSIEKAAAALAVMGFEPRHCPLHIIAIHFRVFVRSCGEYALAILPLNNTHLKKLEECKGYETPSMQLAPFGYHSFINISRPPGPNKGVIHISLLISSCPPSHNNSFPFRTDSYWLEMPSKSTKSSPAYSDASPSSASPCLETPSYDGTHLNPDLFMCKLELFSRPRQKASELGNPSACF